MFTKEQLIAEARRQYGKPICLDMVADAMAEETLREAVEVLIIDSLYWDESPCI